MFMQASNSFQDRRLRIVIVFGSPGTSFGSVERGFLELVKKLISKGFRIAVTVTAPGIFVEELRKAGATVKIITMERRINLRAIYAIINVLKDYRPQILHINFDIAVYNTLVAALVARFFGYQPCKIVVHHHSQIADPSKKQFRYLPRKLLYKLNHVESVFVSTAQRERFELKGIVPYNGRQYVIENGVDTVTFHPVSSLNEKQDARHRIGLNLSPDVKVVGYVAGYRPEKRHIFLLEAFEEALRRTQHAGMIVLLLVGYGSEETRIKHEIVRRNLSQSVIMTGQRTDIPDIFRALDVAVCVSTNESFNLGIMEALATGLPVICVANSFTETIIDTGINGIVMPSDVTAAEFGTMLASIINSRLDASKMGGRGRAVAEAFSVSRWTDRILEVYISA
ncbi:MAG: glycosyltransferase family 4 protein [Firmicutes bacterium]|nr:glycosyltransferase family 4 protein [Bacillota bacterium]